MVRLSSLCVLKCDTYMCMLRLDNRLFHPHTHIVKGGMSSKQQQPPDADHMRRAFKHMCSDKDALASFYDRVWSILKRLARAST